LAHALLKQRHRGASQGDRAKCGSAQRLDARDNHSPGAESGHPASNDSGAPITSGGPDAGQHGGGHFKVSEHRIPYRAG